MTNTEEQVESQSQNKPREDLFTEPLSELIEKLNSFVRGHLQSLQSAEIAAGAAQRQAELHKALDSVTPLRRMVSESSHRATELLETASWAERLANDVRSPMRALAQIDLSPLLEELHDLRLAATRYQELYEALRSTYLGVLQGFATTFASEFQSFLDQLSRAHARRLERALRQYHWWPVPGLPDEFYLGILELIGDGQTRGVNRYICDWFSWNRYRRLGRMVRRWANNEYFRRRRPIYNQPLQAHRRGWYNLTVPALIPLVEGVARDYLQGQHGITERSGRRAIEEALDRNIPPGAFREELQQALIRFLTSSTFADTRGVLPSGYELNRHGVAHSRHLRYGTEANSLRCFLLLETLYQFIEGGPAISWF
ncbi:MAG: hypothetical protein ACOC6F_03395 [bacterium]